MELFERQFNKKLGLGEDLESDRFSFSSLNENKIKDLDNGTKPRSQIIGEAWHRVEDSLKIFASRSDFSTQMQVAFGDEFDVAEVSQFAASWLQGEFGSFPTIEIRDAAEINEANGAFAAATNTIYMSREFVDRHAKNLDVVTDVLLEEYGHYIDSRINVTDTGGDEGTVFAALVRGEELSAAELAALKREDDGAIVFLDGEEVAIEQAETTTQTNTLNFFAGEIKGWGSTLERSEYTFFDNKIPDPPIDSKFDFGIVEFDAELQALLKGSIFVDPGNLGNVKFSYPIDVTFDLPNSLSFGEDFSIQPTTSVSNAAFDTFESQGYQTPDAGIEFGFKPEKAKLSNIELTTFLGFFDDNDDGKVDGIDDINLIDNIGEIKLGYTVSQFVQDALQVDLPGNLGKIQVALPKIDKGDIQPSNSSDSDGALPTIAAVGKTKSQNNFINLELDIDRAAALVFRPLGLLSNTLKFPTSEKEKERAESVKNNLEFKRDELKGIEKEIVEIRRQVKELGRQSDELFQIGTLEARQEATNLVRIAQGLDQVQQELEARVPGLKQEVEQLEQSSKEAERQIEKADKEANKRFNFELGYDLLDLDINLGVGFQQDFAFNPDDGVKVTLSVDKGSVDGGQVSTKNSGESFMLQAPSEGSGVMTVTAKYELSGQLENTVNFVPKGTLDFKALEFSASAKFAFLNFSTGKIGPLISANLLEGAFSDPIPFIGTDPNGASINSFYRQFDPLKLENIGGTEAVTDENPEPGATKNLVIEKTYEIPYGVPIMVTDASTIEGSSSSDGNQAIFTVSLSEPSNEPVTLAVEYANQTTSSGDYLPLDSTVTIPAGQLSANLAVPIVPDTEQEETETFTVTLTRPDGTPISEGVPTIEATGTILDDDDKPEPPENKAATYNDPRVITFDKQYHDFQAAGEFTLIDSLSGDLKIQVRQQPVGNNPNSNLTENTAVATILGGKRIGLYKDTPQLLIDGVPTEIPNNDSLVVGDGRIYREGNIYTIVYPTGDQLVAKVVPSSRINLSAFLTEERQGQIQGLLGNFNGNAADDLAKRDGTVLGEPVPREQLYGEYADSWRITQAESLFDYQPGEDTKTFTLPNFPLQKVTLADLNPEDVAIAEERIGDSITDPTIREATIIDYILTGFDETIIEEAIVSPIPDRIVPIVVPPKAFADFADTTTNTPVTLDILRNDTGTLGVPLLLADFDPTTTNGGNINRNDNGTPGIISDDFLTYTPPVNFLGTDSFNYTLSDGTQIAAGTVTVRVLEPIVIPLTTVEDVAITTTNTPITLDVLSNDSGMPGVPLLLADFNPTSINGGIISRNENGTPNDLNDDVLTYTPPANFVGRDRFNYTLSDGTQIASGNVTIAVSADATTLISLNGIADGDFSGVAVSGIGDFNRDGFDDVAIGALGADPNGINAAGETYVVFGTPAGFPANFNLAELNGTNGFILNGIDAESFSGSSVSHGGDFNGDGFDDLIIGAFAASANSQDDAGKTYIIFGTNQTLPTRFDLSQLNGSNGFVLNGTNEFDYVGIAVNSAGDLNADGFDDLLIAAPGGLGGDSGKTYIFYGGSKNVPANLTLADLEAASEELLTFTRGFQLPVSAAISRGRIVVSGINSQPSTSVNGIGDLNGDGFDDVAIAPEPNEDNPVSESYVLFGSASDFGDLNLAELDGNNGFILTNLDPNANPSLSSAGDVNNDGIEDLIIGLPEATVGNLPNAGKTYVVFGSQEGFGDRFDVSQLDGSNGFVLNGSEIDELVGSSVSAAGDINSDGIDDLIIGAAGATVNDLPSAGKVYAVFGRETGFPVSLNLAELNGSNGFVLNGSDADDLTGISVSAAGDTNGDTIDDFIVGAPGNLFNNTSGKSYLVFGSPSYGFG